MDKVILTSLILFNIVEIQGDDLYASFQGSDENPCSKEEPCRSLSYACQLASTGTTINVQGDDIEHYDINNITLDKSLSIKGWVKSPTFRCEKNEDLCNFDIHSGSNDNCHLNLTDIIMADCNLCFKSSSLSVAESSLSATSILMQLLEDGESSMDLDMQGSQLENVELTFHKVGSIPDSQLSIKAENMLFEGPDTSLSIISDADPYSELRVSLNDVTFRHMQKPITFSNFSDINFEGNGVQLYNFTTELHCMGFLFDAASSGDVLMTNSSFSDNFCNHGALGIAKGEMDTYISVTNCTFSSNNALLGGSGLKVTDSQNFEVTGSTFYNNFNSESAAGMLVGNSNANITGCVFKNNTVYTGNTLVMGQTDSWERKGSGAALYVSGGSQVLLDECVFVDNSADWFGGSVASFGEITIQNSYFEHREVDRMNSLGSMLYITGPTKLENNICNATQVKTLQALIWYTSTDKASTLSWVDTGYMEVYCPPGSEFINSTLRNSLDFDAPFNDFLYVCKSCDPGYYSLENGYRIGSIYNESVSYSSDFECRECPYGGQCENGLVIAIENFWGYQVQKGDHKEISFLSCPAGYCCAGDECQSYDSCHEGRSGDICGRCIEGYSELVFATECYPNEDCHDYWYLAIDVANALVFVLLFLYQMEVGTFVATKLLGRSPKGQQSGSPSAVNAYIKSFFYFYQTVNLLAVADNRASAVIGLSLQPVMAAILSFSPIAALIATCPFPNMSPVAKTLLRTTPTIYIYIGVGLCAIGLVIHDKVKSKKLQEARDREYITDSVENVMPIRFEREPPGESSTDPPESAGTTYLSHNFRSRLSRACTNIFLLNYLTLSTMTLSMLVCKNVGTKDVLYMDGTIECIAGWQSVFIIVAIIHTMPFFLSVIVSRVLLEEQRISVTEFFLSYVFPLPVLIYWAAMFGKDYWRTRKVLSRRGETFVSMVSAPDEVDVVFVNTQKDNSIKQEILFIVEDPYLKIGVDRSKSLLYWEGILILRRLILLMMFVFTTNPLLQMTLQTSTCLIFLVWHMMVQPFRSKAANNVEAVSLTVLTIVGILHTIQATFMSAGRRPSGPNDLQITITDWIEWILVSLPPLLVITLVILLILFRILRAIGQCMCFVITKLLSLCGKVPPCRDREQYNDLD